jgi:hypothetical protein
MEEEGRYMAWRSGGRKRERLKGGLSVIWRWTVVDGYRWRGGEKPKPANNCSACRLYLIPAVCMARFQGKY